MWPGEYWRLYTDAIVHTIHRRVFEHVKHLSEAEMERCTRLCSTPPTRVLHARVRKSLKTGRMSAMQVQKSAKSAQAVENK